MRGICSSLINVNNRVLFLGKLREIDLAVLSADDLIELTIGTFVDEDSATYNGHAV